MPAESGAQTRTGALPTGTVTFLFTDIEGSAERWERHRDAMRAAVARHEQVLSGAMARHGGYIFKTLGDALCVAFATAPDAVRAAADAQRALAGEDFSAVGGLRVRMGLHTGYAEERNADYFGPAVNRVARLMSIGHGGQILLSGATHELAQSEAPANTALADLGAHRLRDLAEPEHVWQLSVTGLESSFPSLRSLDALPNNLPIQPTSFRGREQDLEEVKRLLERHRVLTLVGSGGVGKTRLAVQVGADLLDRFPDGVWLADIAPITDPELVASVVGSALGMGQSEDRRVDEAIPAWLRGKRLLLIMDNCEHLLGATAVLADAIQRNAPNVRILATSRQALGIAGEAAHRLPSLAVPESGAALRAEDALSYGAIAVFADRAALADTRFTLTDDNAPIVADICRHLDGIPLAIELAAARVKVLSIPNLAHRLSERFKLLTSGGRTAVPRQKTLGALLDWSYDLLTPQEQMLFSRLGIFAGGFSLDAATAVCTGEGIDDVDVLDLLASLTDKSLVVADTGGASERYHLLESTRAYALEKLETKGERERCARRHAEYYRDHALAADDRYGMGSTLAWFAEVQQELDNYRSVLEWALTDGNDAVIGGQIAGAMDQLWYRGGLSKEGRYWIDLALTHLDEKQYPGVAARLLQALAVQYSAKETMEAAARAVQLYEAAEDERGAARARNWLAYGLYQMGRYEEADRESSVALESARRTGDRFYEGRGIGVLGMIASQTGKSDVSRELHAQSSAVHKSLGDELSTAIVLGNVAELEFADGHPEEAIRLVTEALRMDSRRGVDALNLAVFNGNSAAYHIAMGNLDEAHRLAREAIHYARQTQATANVAIHTQHFGLIRALRGDLAGGARLGGYADAQLGRLGVARETTEKWGYEKLMAALRANLSDAEIEKFGAEGAAWSEDRALEEALKA